MDRLPQPPGDCRCLCGNLLARLVAGGVELKCRRCKRTLVVALEEPQRASRRAGGGRWAPLREISQT
jgi:phage FluMu protein Com